MHWKSIIPSRKLSENHCRNGHLSPPETRAINKDGTTRCITCSRLSREKWKQNNPEKTKELQRRATANYRARRKDGISIPVKVVAQVHGEVR